MLDVELRAPHNMNNMTSVAQCGFDLYVYDEQMKELLLWGKTEEFLWQVNYDRR